MAVAPDPMPTLNLKHRGTFDHQKFVKGVQDWFVENNYKFHAPKYKLKADEAEYEIEGERDITEYVRYKIAVHIWIRDLKDVEVIENGEKKKLQEGSVQIEVNGRIEFDWSNRFRGNKFVQWLQDIYQKYVIRQTITDVWEDDCMLKMVELLGKMKELLGTEVS